MSFCKKMFSKGCSIQARMMSFQNKAAAYGRNIIGKMNLAYHAGRHIAGQIDRAYGVAKKLHGAMAPALADASPELARAAKKTMGSYEQTRAAVVGVHAAGERIAAAMRA